MSIPIPLVIVGKIFPCHPHYANCKGSDGIASKHHVLTPNPRGWFASETLLSRVAVVRAYADKPSSAELWSVRLFAIICQRQDLITFKSP